MSQITHLTKDIIISEWLLDNLFFFFFFFFKTINFVQKGTKNMSEGTKRCKWSVSNLRFLIGAAKFSAHGWTKFSTVQHALVKHGFPDSIHPAKFLLFSFKHLPFCRKNLKINTDSSNFSPLFTNKKSKSTRNKTNLERLDQNFTFLVLWQVGLATTEPNHRLNGVNYLRSRPAIKAVNSCTYYLLKKQACFIYFFLALNTAYLNSSSVPNEFEESV